MRLPFEQETIFSVKPSASFGQPEDPGPPPEAPGIYLLRQGMPLIVTEPWVYFLAPVEFSASYTSFNAVTSILRSRANSWGDNLLWFCPLIKGFRRSAFPLRSGIGGFLHFSLAEAGRDAYHAYRQSPSNL